jgi:hypothetical protein
VARDRRGSGAPTSWCGRAGPDVAAIGAVGVLARRARVRSVRRAVRIAVVPADSSARCARERAGEAGLEEEEKRRKKKKEKGKRK